MNYKEKIKLAEQISIQFKEGKDYNFIKQWMREKELKKYDYEKVIVSAKKMLKSEFVDQIIPALESNNEKSVHQILSKLSPELIKDIKEEGVMELKRRYKNEVNKRVKSGERDEDIIKDLKMHYFNQDEIERQISFYKKYNEAPKGDEKDKYLLTGVPLVIIGLLIVLFVRLPSGRPPSLAFLLIIFGGWNIYKAFTPPGVAELSDLNDKFK